MLRNRKTLAHAVDVEGTEHMKSVATMKDVLTSEIEKTLKVKSHHVSKYRI